MPDNVQGARRAFRRYIGLELAGPHSERTAVVVLDEYPLTERLVVSVVLSGLGAREDKTSDAYLIDVLKDLSETSGDATFVGLATQAPTTLPPFFRNATESHLETRWMLDLWNKTKPKPRPFLAYLNRPVEVWLRYFTPERFQIPEAMGANLAPIAARIQALKAGLPTPTLECFPRASLSRLVTGSGLNRFWPKLYTDTEKGIGVREEFLQRLQQLFAPLFIYDGDLETLIVELPVFQSFLSALSLFLNGKNYCESRPDGFPESASWILLPRQKIRWDELFKRRSVTD